MLKVLPNLAVERQCVDAPADVVCVLDDGRVLCGRGERLCWRLHAWDPLTGEDDPVALEGGGSLGLWWDARDCGRSSNGSALLCLSRREGGSRACGQDWVQVAPDGLTARVLCSFDDDERRCAAALLPDGTFYWVDEVAVWRRRPGQSIQRLFP